jgi:hypothetical protein
VDVYHLLLGGNPPEFSNHLNSHSVVLSSNRTYYNRIEYLYFSSNCTQFANEFLLAHCNKLTGRILKAMTRASRGLDVRETSYTVQGHVRVLEHPDRRPLT